MTTATVDTPSTRLGGMDRCDRCRAQAYVEVTTPVGPLLFCAHHYARHEDVLTAAGYDVHDERHKLAQE